ncbi:MAG TPA: DUF6335 family protein [Methylomirabilota bacterium]|nr:DUF6335 family protein [Methylomirabilota bacterium]
MKKSKRGVKRKERASAKRRGRAKPAMKPSRRPARRAKRPRRTTVPGPDESSTSPVEERLAHAESTPLLTGGDVDADWKGAASVGEEAVGGTVATPDQDRVDDIGRALGVERSPTAPVVTSDEVLRDRDRRRWELERRADRRKGRT